MAAALTGPRTVPGEPWPTTLSLLLLLFLLPPTQVAATAHRHPASEDVAFSRDVACGQRPVQGRILGGVDALERKWPWQVSVHYTGFHICGGSIVDEYWILSAAHCFDRSTNTEAYDIYVGLVDLLVAGNHTQWFEVNRVIIHPTYELYHPIGGDVALVQLKSRIVFSDAVLPVCIAPPDLTLSNLSCWATGWGSISQQGKKTNLGASRRGAAFLEAPTGSTSKCYEEQVQPVRQVSPSASLPIAVTPEAHRSPKTRGA
ncbi:serine protease 38 [Dama dama]